ncbi:MAG: low-specificity L-threonine aldolase [Acidiferrobacterales bacterium]
MKTIDLRSDTVTKPTPAMRTVMAEADVGDDVYGEDPTINGLENLAAATLGFEAAVFVPSGTQGNLIGVLSHCERGDEYIVGQEAHTYKNEAGGAAVLGSIQPQPLDFESDGTLDLGKIRQAIKPEDYHYARTRLLCLENTQAGKVLPLAYLDQVAALAREHGLSLHLDGARVFNAAVKLDVPVREITQRFDSVSFCLSKGLGAPVGSVLCASAPLAAKARRWRKMLGGGMRQAGILAAAGIYALNHNINRLTEDHDNAKLLAEGLSEIEELAVDPQAVQTNMVFASVDPAHSSALIAFLKEREILVSSGAGMRLVTHLDVTAADMHATVNQFKAFFANSPD